MRERIARLGNVALATPFALNGPLHDGTLSTRIAWMGLRGVSVDRLEVLGQEYAERFILPNLRQVGLDLLKESARRDERSVLISDNIDVIVRHVAEHLEITDWVCNSLELRDDKATGRLQDPIIAGHTSVDWARAFASEHSIDMAASCGYGAHGDDSMLLNAIGKPCVVSPDRQLRRIARDLDWPVVEG
jgi:phosphoserine phosphatase